ncbi:MAG: hypothetical protein PHP46_00730, partial [Candidatus Omnitrophica bacterium]|nr:hypothetical protein [Candidatus Omnitrophota bacterium]
MKNYLSHYAEEFKAVRTEVIKSRLRLFCALALFVFVGVSVAYLIFDPKNFNRNEVGIWVFLTIMALVVLVLNRAVKTLIWAKLNAFLFALSLVIALAAAFVIYDEYSFVSASLFSISIFFISFVLPWGLLDIGLIGVAHTSAYIFISYTQKTP